MNAQPVHAVRDDALGTADAVELVRRVHEREVSIPELVEAGIERAAAVDPQLNAIAFEDPAAARASAQAPSPGFFAGIPTFIKDNVALAGAPTQEGTAAFVARVKDHDGDYARMFKATGLIPLGKTRLSEFGFSASAEPMLGEPVRNPWDTEYSTGASSAGSAALVAAGVVPIAHANDGGGSIRIPAACNGLVGLKPSRNRMPQDKLMRQMPVQIIHDGVVTRSVRDTAAFIREAERVWRNPKLPAVGDVTRAGPGRLRIAVVEDGFRPTAPDVKQGVHDTVELLEGLGHFVEPIEIPVDARFQQDFLLYWSLLSLTVTKMLRREHGDGFKVDNLEPLTVGLAEHARRNLHKLPGTIRRLRGSSRQSAKVFGTYDAVLTPTLAHGPPKLGHLDGSQDYETVIERLQDWATFTPLYNASGDPAISLPLATSAEGMPVGMQFAAGMGREALLLGLAYELEEARPWPLLGH